MSQSKEPMPLNDAALEEYLRGESSVSRHYRLLPEDAPPAALDRQVLAQARAALGTKAVARRPSWVRWGAPVAVAASAVMALSIVMQGGLQQAEVSPSVLMIEESPAPGAAADQQSSAPSAGEVAPERDVTVIDLTATNPPPPPAIETPVPLPEQPALRRQTAPQGAQPARGVDAPVISRQKNGVLSSPAITESRNMTATDRAVSADAPLATQSERRVMAPAPTAPTAPAAPPPAVATTPTASSMQAAPVIQLSPEAWLSEIRRLRLDGEVAQADRQWQRFREAFPDYAVTDADPARPPGCRGGC